MQLILVTGATGFLGRELCSWLSSSGFKVRAVIRSETLGFSDNIESVIIPDINSTTDWTEALVGVDCVIHCAAISSASSRATPRQARQMHELNVLGTKRLVEEAAKKAVRRFIFISSIKVNGSGTSRNSGFTENDPPAPVDSYGLSKWAAECAIREVECSGGIEVVILRPPLVYGEGAKGNLNKLTKLIRLGIPLPFKSIVNERSILSLDNAMDIILRCINSKSVAGETLLIADRVPITTPHLLRQLANDAARPLILFAVPAWVLRVVAFMFGKTEEIERLMDSLVINSSKLETLLGSESKRLKAARIGGR